MTLTAEAAAPTSLRVAPVATTGGTPATHWLLSASAVRDSVTRA
ncbi:hypothetical protein [Nostoc sp.]